MTTLAESIDRVVDALAGDDDAEAARQVLTLFAFPPDQVAAVLEPVILTAAEGWRFDDLTWFATRRLPLPGEIAATVDAVAEGDLDTIWELAGEDIVDVVVHLAATASGLVHRR